MEAIFLIYLAIFWLIFWSFWSVLIFRFYSQEKWILAWRSHCTSCNTNLSFLDLFPVFSYLFLWWKCRYCKKSIPLIYPILEITMSFVFFLVWLYLVDLKMIYSLNIMEISRMFFFLWIAFVVVVMSYYDILYKLIPIELFWPTILLLVIMHIVWFVDPNFSTFFWYFIAFQDNSILNRPILNALAWSFLIYSFFYLQIILPWIYYAIEKKKYKIIMYEIIEYFTLPIWMILSPFTKEKWEWEDINEEDEVYTFMWHWDLWIWVFMWLVAWFKMALVWLVMAYLIWSIIWIYILTVKKQRNYRLAFWPFLWAWLIIALIWYDTLTRLFFSIFKIN